MMLMGGLSPAVCLPSSPRWLNFFLQGDEKDMYRVEMQRTITQIAVLEFEDGDKSDAIRRAREQREIAEWETTDTDYDFPDVSEVA